MPAKESAVLKKLKADIKALEKQKKTVNGKATKQKVSVAVKNISQFKVIPTVLPCDIPILSGGQVIIKAIAKTTAKARSDAQVKGRAEEMGKIYAKLLASQAAQGAVEKKCPTKCQQKVGEALNIENAVLISSNSGPTSQPDKKGKAHFKAEYIYSCKWTYSMKCIKKEEKKKAKVAKKR